MDFHAITSCSVELILQVVDGVVIIAPPVPTQGVLLTDADGIQNNGLQSAHSGNCSTLELT